MSIDPQLIQLFAIVLFGGLPFPLGMLALWLADRAPSTIWARRLAKTGVLLGVVFLIWFFVNFRISKYPHVDFTFGVIFFLWLAIMGGIIGGIIDRITTRYTRSVLDFGPPDNHAVNGSRR